jgi:hypothetical protein
MVIASQSVMKVKHRVRSAKDLNNSSEIFRQPELLIMETSSKPNVLAWGNVFLLLRKVGLRETNRIPELEFGVTSTQTL